MARLEYEKETCGRCGGSGHYSYNQINGTTCFGCGGSGKRLSKRSKATKARADEMLNIPVETVKVGDQIRVTDTLTGKWWRQTVREIKVSVMAWQVMPDGQKLPINRYNFNDIPFGLSQGFNVRRSPTEEEVAYLIEYQDNLTKAGTPRKRRAAQVEEQQELIE